MNYMSKYKLIKTFPNSPKLGFIAEFNYNKEDYKGIKSIQEAECINYPEFWEKVEELDYEILSFICNNPESDYYVKGSISQKIEGTDNLLIDTNNCTSKVRTSCLGSGWDIYSIKRLSDGEIFTVGDAVVHKNGNAGQIHKFHILSNGIWFKTSGFDIPMCYVADKVKVSLFRTEDGVDIFKGDKYYVVDSNYDVMASSYTGKWTTSEHTKFFRDIKVAQSYIDENKPKYSENDMLDFGEHVHNFEDSRETLKKSLNSLFRNKFKTNE